MKASRAYKRWLKALSALLQKEVVDAGFSVSSFAQICGLHPATVNRLLSQETRFPSARTIFEVTHALAWDSAPLTLEEFERRENPPRAGRKRPRRRATSAA